MRKKKDQFQEWNTYQITTDDNNDVIVDYKTNKIKTKYFVFFWFDLTNQNKASSFSILIW